MEPNNARYIANRSSALKLRVGKLIEDLEGFTRDSGSSRLRGEKYCFCVRRGQHSFCYRRRWRWHTLLERGEDGSFAYADGDFVTHWAQAESSLRGLIESVEIEIEVLGEIL